MLRGPTSTLLNSSSWRLDEQQPHQSILGIFCHPILQRKVQRYSLVTISHESGDALPNVGHNEHSEEMEEEPEG